MGVEIVDFKFHIDSYLNGVIFTCMGRKLIYRNPGDYKFWMNYGF